MTETNLASQHFNMHWGKYQEAIKNNTLWHQEMMAALSSFIDKHMGSKPFSFVDVGCGDSSTIVPVLVDKFVKKYTGIDAAPDVLKLAEKNLERIRCEKEFIFGNMLDAIVQLNTPVDMIFTSYAVHHLSYQQKVEFINKCQQCLSEGGYLLMIDGVLKENQTREQWLDELEKRMNTTQKLLPQELESRMQHPREADFPEAIATFKKIAQEQTWEKFNVLVEKDISALMVFQKAGIAHLAG